MGNPDLQQYVCCGGLLLLLCPFFPDVKMFRYSFILSFVVVFLFHLFEFNLISQKTACLIVSNTIKKNNAQTIFEGGVTHEQINWKYIGKPIEINWKSIEISWKSVESKLKSIENQLKATSKVNWNQKSVEINWLNIIQTPVPQKLLA